MFKSIKRKWRYAEAATVLQNVAEEMSKQGIFDGNAGMFGRTMIKGATNAHPEVFDARNGHLPHKVPFAATALAMAIQRAPIDGQVFPRAMIALGMILRGAQENMNAFAFSPQDITMLDTAMTIFMSLDEAADYTLCSA